MSDGTGREPRCRPRAGAVDVDPPLRLVSDGTVDVAPPRPVSDGAAWRRAGSAGVLAVIACLMRSSSASSE
ncbi:hypothetical protein BBK14_02215 [Parafrankia soli]|uniref:Uncharacterized protein n=1 Tax=Parafrankia soli TaxID=2599596 RepID=A0A1S1QR96_9ACTN|nr:hypothetical protein BBK14_02215 [Parafrankia soli]